jgi:hypothetical protein
MARGRTVLTDPTGTHDDSTVADGPAIVVADTSGTPRGYVNHPISLIAGQARTKQTRRRRQGVPSDEEESQGSPDEEEGQDPSEDEQGSGPPERRVNADSALVPEGK